MQDKTQGINLWNFKEHGLGILETNRMDKLLSRNRNTNSNDGKWYQSFRCRSIIILNPRYLWGWSSNRWKWYCYKQACFSSLRKCTFLLPYTVKWRSRIMLWFELFYCHVRLSPDIEVLRGINFEASIILILLVGAKKITISRRPDQGKS